MPAMAENSDATVILRDLHPIAVSLQLVQHSAPAGTRLAGSGLHGGMKRIDTAICSTQPTPPTATLSGFKLPPLAVALRMASRTTTPVATLGDLRRVSCWFWVCCDQCHHKAPVALVPLISVARSCPLHRIRKGAAAIGLPGPAGAHAAWGLVEIPSHWWRR